VAELDPEEVIKPLVDGLTHHPAVVIGPAPDSGVELTDPLPLRQGLTALEDPSKLGEMVLHLGLGGVAQGFAPQTPLASRAFARVGFADPVLPKGKSQQLNPGLLTFQGIAHTTVCC